MTGPFPVPNSESDSVKPLVTGSSGLRGNDEPLKEAAKRNALKIGAGHTFVIVLKDAFPINILNAVKMCQEVCTVFCATANPVEVILAQSETGQRRPGSHRWFSPKGR